MGWIKIKLKEFKITLRGSHENKALMLDKTGSLHIYPLEVRCI